MVIFIATAWNEKRRVGTESLPLASRREARVGGGGLSHGSPIHVTTPHYPTHAGRDARGPQNSAGPVSARGMVESGRARNHSPLASQWEARVGGGVLCRKCPIHVTTPHYPAHAGRDARGPQNSAYPSHTTAPCRRGRRRSQGLLPHPCGQGCPRTTHRRRPTHHTTAPCRRGRRRSEGPPPTHAGEGDPTDPHQPSPTHRRSAWTNKQSQACGITRCRTIRGRWPGRGQG